MVGLPWFLLVNLIMPTHVDQGDRVLADDEFDGDSVADFGDHSPFHQCEHAPAHVFSRVSGVSLGIRVQFGPNLLR